MKVLRYIFVMLAVLLAAPLAVSAQEADSIRRVIFIPVQFADSSFTYGIDMIGTRLEEAETYFNSQLEGKLSYSFDLAPTVTLSMDAAYYGENNSNGHDRKIGALVYEACHLSNDEVDFSIYDCDRDGTVDRVFIICAGGNEAEDGLSTSFWSQNWDLKQACHESQDYDKEYLVLDGIRISTFAVTSEFKHDSGNYELMGIGMICHEFGHFLGLPDMYDTDGELSGGLSVGLWGSTSLMDRGNFNGDSDNPPYLNAIEMDMLGTGAADTLREGLNTLHPIGSNRRYIRCSSNDGTCYYLECRRTVGRDSGCGGNGLLIYHVDKTDSDAGFSSNLGRSLTAAERWSDINEINCRPDRQCAEIMPAASEPTQVQDVFFPCGEVNNYGPVGSWLLKDITLAADGSVSFTASSIYLDSFTADCFQDAAIMSWHSTIETGFSLYLNGELIAENVGPYDKGKYSYTVEGLEPSQEYEIILIPLIGPNACYKFKTRPYYSSVPPFMELRSVSRNSDGSFPAGTGFPLKISSCNDIKSVIWTLDNSEISTGEDGYCHIDRSGTLKAAIITAGGKSITILKDIVIR